MEDSDEDDDNTEPLPGNLNYRRSWKDVLKLLILPPLYFSFMVIATIVAFFSIQALFLSYKHRVRSVHTVHVQKYHVIGVAFFPDEHATYDFCDFKYADDLTGGSDHWSSLQPPGQVCTYTNVTFYSDSLLRNRTALVFNGPTLVHLKQSLAVLFHVNTTVQDYSAIQFILLGHWDQVLYKTKEDKAAYLAQQERSMPLSTVSAGFRTWIKMTFSLQNNKTNHNITDFSIHADLAAYNDRRNASDRDLSPVFAVFEWKGDTYDYVTEILSTTAWNTLGSLAGVFITLIKVGEYTHRWIKRMRRERKKKLLKRAEIEEDHRKKVEQYLQKKMEKELRRLTSRKSELLCTLNP